MGRVSEKHRGRKDTASVAAAPRARVLLPLPLAGAYDYRVPPGAQARPGDFVVAPLNQREVIGVVWDREANSPEPPLPDSRLSGAVTLDIDATTGLIADPSVCPVIRTRTYAIGTEPRRRCGPQYHRDQTFIPAEPSRPRRVSPP